MENRVSGFGDVRRRLELDDAVDEQLLGGAGKHARNGGIREIRGQIQQHEHPEALNIIADVTLPCRSVTVKRRRWAVSGAHHLSAPEGK